MSKLVAGLILTISLITPLSVCADEPVVLTPTKLYDLTEENRKTSGVLITGLGEQSLRINHTEERIKELERKVKGMQKQITILHAKKADKQ